MLGTRGVPARYGGFETAVEEIGARLVEFGHDVTVYSRNPGQSLTEFRGMRVINLPAIHHRFAETFSHTAISSVHAIALGRPDVAVVLNSGNAPFVRPLRLAGIPTVAHMDGLEARREKWRGAGAKYFRWAERKAVIWADRVIADSVEIGRIIDSEFHRRATYIPYGAEVFEPSSERLGELGLIRRDYHLVVARFEPENHVLEIVQAYRMSDETRPVVVVGSSPYSQWYVNKVNEAAAGDSRVRLVGGIYDQELLNQLYGNCRTYVHGHSVGGTNPSLLRAMGAGAPVMAFDCAFNREVLAGKALWWSSIEQLSEHFDEIAHSESGDDVDKVLREFSRLGQDRVAHTYSWDSVTRDYERVLLDVVAEKRL